MILPLTQLYRYTPDILPHLNIPTGPPSDELDMNIQGTSVVYMWLVTIVVVERGGGATGSDVTGSGPDRKSHK